MQWVGNVERVTKRNPSSSILMYVLDSRSSTPGDRGKQRKDVRERVTEG
jgi:hypothetical protein